MFSKYHNDEQSILKTNNSDQNIPNIFSWSQIELETDIFTKTVTMVTNDNTPEDKTIPKSRKREADGNENYEKNKKSRIDSTAHSNFGPLILSFLSGLMTKHTYASNEMLETNMELKNEIQALSKDQMIVLIKIAIKRCINGNERYFKNLLEIITKKHRSSSELNDIFKNICAGFPLDSRKHKNIRKLLKKYMLNSNEDERLFVREYLNFDSLGLTFYPPSPEERNISVGGKIGGTSTKNMNNVREYLNFQRLGLTFFPSSVSGSTIADVDKGKEPVEEVYKIF